METLEQLSQFATVMIGSITMLSFLITVAVITMRMLPQTKMWWFRVTRPSGSIAPKGYRAVTIYRDHSKQQFWADEMFVNREGHYYPESRRIYYLSGGWATVMRVPDHLNFGNDIGEGDTVIEGPYHSPWTDGRERKDANGNPTANVNEQSDVLSGTSFKV